MRVGFKSFKEAVRERFGFVEFRKNVLKRRVPEPPWYQGDGAALTTLFVVQIVSGAAMTLLYTNSTLSAYQSVRNITDYATLGWLLRGIHYWGAGIMVVMLFLHLCRHLLLGGYKAPREGTWIIGVFQFFLVLTMSFTGYVLRWDERAVYAARVVLNMFYNVPFIGEELVLLVQGGPELGSATLSRFYSVHTLWVPLLLLGLVGVHLYLIVIHGVTSKIEMRETVETAEEQKEVYKEAAHSEEEGEWFHPHTVLLTGFVAFLVFIGVYSLALIAGPQDLYPEGNLTQTSMPREEWWFFWYSSLIAILPRRLVPVFIVAFPLVLFFGMLLLPLLDRGPNRGVRKRPIWTAVVILAVAGILFLSDLRLKSPWTGWPDPNPPPIPAGLVLTAKVERGRQLFALKGCNSCHSVGSHGREVGPDLARIEHSLSPSELRNYILAPARGVPMPSYRGRISEQDLEAVVEFVLVAQTFPHE
ncbi:MAG: cytochrome b N-terminal domain-containing protein [Syntrophobacteraceae bacterium]